MVDRARRKARTRAAILDAARDRFVLQGFTGTTIRDVAAAAGVSVGTIHAHFSDKQGLLRACFDHQIEGAVQLGLESLDTSAPVADQLTHLARVLYAAYGRHPALSREMFQDSLFSAESADPILADFLGELAALFRAALARGELTRLPDNGLRAAHGWFSAYLLTLIGGLAGHYGDPSAPGSLDAWTAAFRSLLVVQLVGLGASPELLQSTPPKDVP
jgi:AcrR family transcriptional regulator